MEELIKIGDKISFDVTWTFGYDSAGTDHYEKVVTSMKDGYINFEDRTYLAQTGVGKISFYQESGGHSNIDLYVNINNRRTSTIDLANYLYRKYC